MPDNPGTGTSTVVATEELLTQLKASDETMTTGFQEIREAQTASEKTWTTSHEKLVEENAQLRKDMDGLRLLQESMDKTKLDLPGTEDVKHSNGRTLAFGDFLVASCVEKSGGKKAVEERGLGLCYEVSDQVKKHADNAALMRFMNTQLDTQGGFLVPEQKTAEFVDLVRSKRVFAKLPLRMVTGLTGSPYKVDRLTLDPVPFMVGEGVAIPESTPTVGQATFTERKGGVLFGMTREQMMFSPPGNLQVIENAAAEQLALLWELQAFEGPGGENEVLGLENIPGISTFDATVLEPNTIANGRDLTDFHMKRIAQVSEEADVPMDAHAYLMHTKIKNVLSQTFRAEGATTGVIADFPNTATLQGLGLMSNAQLDTLYGNIAFTTQLRTDLTDGSSSDLGNVFSGNWNMFWFLMWGGLFVDTSSVAVIGTGATQSNAFTEEKTFTKITQIFTAGSPRPTDLLKSTGFRTVRSGV